MKKIVSILLAAVMIFSIAGCGKKEEKPVKISFQSAEDLLNQIYETYEDEERFPVGGGDSEHMTMEKPGTFDIAKTEELDVTLGLPAAEAENIDDAASMVHMMNANLLTCGAYHVVKGTDEAAFIEAVKQNILSRQWLCGSPDKVFFANAGDGYVISAFGESELMDTLKEKLQSLGLQIVAEEAVTES